MRSKLQTTSPVFRMCFPVLETVCIGEKTLVKKDHQVICLFSLKLTIFENHPLVLLTFQPTM